MIDIERKKQQAINDFYETHCEAPHEIDLLFGFDSGYNLGLDERDALSAQVERLREDLARCRQQASYSIGSNEALAKQLSNVRDIANEALRTTNKSGGGDEH